MQIRNGARNRIATGGRRPVVDPSPPPTRSVSGLVKSERARRRRSPGSTRLGRSHGARSSQMPNDELWQFVIVIEGPRVYRVETHVVFVNDELLLAWPNCLPSRFDDVFVSAQMDVYRD
ncbi:unnamed protein product, partial [Iphiclides podalirius]